MIGSAVNVQFADCRRGMAHINGLAAIARVVGWNDTNGMKAAYVLTVVVAKPD